MNQPDRNIMTPYFFLEKKKPLIFTNGSGVAGLVKERPPVVFLKFLLNPYFFTLDLPWLFDALSRLTATSQTPALFRLCL